MKHLLVDDTHSFRAAGLGDAVVWTCASGLVHVLRQVGEAPHVEVRSPEALIDQAEFDAVGRAALVARDGFEAALRGQERRNGEYAHLVATQTAQLYFSFLCFAVKGLILAKWLEATAGGDRAVVGCPDLVPPRGLGFGVGIHDHVFAALAGEVGGDPPLISVPPVDPEKFWAEFDRVPAFDKAFNVFNRSAGAVACKLWQRFASDTRLGGARGTVLLLSDNDGIEESFPGLVRNGWRIVKAATRALDAAVPSPPVRDLSDLARSLEAIWLDASKDFLPAAIAAAGWRLLWSRASSAIAAHPAHLDSARAAVTRWRESHAGYPGVLLALGNGLYSPAERLLDYCLREAGVAVVCTDHGASLGLGLRHDYTLKFTTSFSDHYLAYNAETRALFEKHRRSPNQKAHVVGTPAVLSRSRFRRLQRAAARARLGVKPGRPALFYVTSLMRNNLPQGFGTGTDFVYADFQRRLTRQFDRFAGQVVVKPYPAHRYADPDQIWVMPLSANTTVAPFGEFRQIRWGADLLLLDICASTMAWALGCGVPLIYVDNPHTPMTDRAARAFREAVFFVDARRPGWEAELAELLATPLFELGRRWQTMAPARAEVSRRFVLGHPGGFAAALVATLNRIADSGTTTTELGEVAA